MAEMTSEKMAAQEEAAGRTDWERQRLDYYLRLRYSVSPCSVDYWLDTFFEQQKAIYNPPKAPSWNQVRKGAGIGFWENAFAFLSDEKTKGIEAKKVAVRRKMQAEVDKTNDSELQRCNAYNIRLTERLQSKLSRFIARNAEKIEEYFMFVLNSDSFALDGSEYKQEFNLVYDGELNQLVMDYRLPVMEQVSQTKEWKVDKNSDVVPKQMNKGEYAELYERVLFDLALRAVGMLFESDSNKVLSSIVFNGACVYNAWQNMPTVLISFSMSKSQYSYDCICRMDRISKVEIAKLKEVRYLDDIHSSKALSSILGNTAQQIGRSDQIKLLIDNCYGGCNGGIFLVKL